MSSHDTIIQPFQAPSPKINEGPVYLITLTSGEFFLAIKSEADSMVVKSVGVFHPFAGKTAAIRTKVISGYKDVLLNANPEDFIDISFPWHRVHDIQNLAYRRKGTAK